MAKVKRRQQSGARAKKKVWVPILSPKIFNEQVVGEAYVVDPSMCVGKIVKSNLTTLTGNMKKQSVNAKLEITEVKEGKAHSKIVRIEINPSAIKRLVRRKRDRIDESLIYQTKDGVKVRLKPFVLTKGITKSSIKSELRKRIKVFLFKTVSHTTYDDLIKSIISNKIQREMRETLSKVYPLRNTEIRIFHTEKKDAKITPAPVLKERVKDDDEQEKPKVKTEVKKTIKEEVKKASPKKKE